ncbi:MAG: ATP-binding protein [Candidatus Glassbacteria bacterium]
MNNDDDKKVQEVRCWEILSCENDTCPVYGNPEKVCWLEEEVDCLMKPGTLAEDKFIEVCSGCEVFEKRLSRALGRRLDDYAINQTLRMLVGELGKRHTELKRTNRRLMRRVRGLTYFGEVAADLASTKELVEILQIILTGITFGDILGFNRAFLFLVDEGERALKGRLAIGPADEEEAHRIWSELSTRQSTIKEIIETKKKIADGVDRYVNQLVRSITIPLDSEDNILIKAMREKKSFNIKRTSEEVNGSESLIDALGTDAFVVVPLRVKEKELGVLVADNIFSKRPITNYDIGLLETFVHQASLAIHNAGLYTRLSEKLKELEEAYRVLQDNQERLVRAEKLAAVGEITAKVAHEIKNPLTSIGGFARSIYRGMSDDDANKTYLEVILQEVERLEGILHDLLSFAHPSPPEKVKRSINEIIEKSLLVLTGEVDKNKIELDLHLRPDLPDVWYDARQLKQVFLNLFKNAIQAMTNGGRLRIESQRTDRWVCVSVMDTGMGIPQENMSKLFLPFFTTKSDGSGLGLPVSHQILKDHNGYIDVSSQEGVGTNFMVYLPVKEDA